MSGDDVTSQLVGKAVRLRRHELGMDASTAAVSAGVSPKTLRSLENGTRRPQVASLYAIERVLQWEPGKIARMLDSGPCGPVPPSGLQVEFVNELPPARGGRNGDPLLSEFADILRQRPGAWAKWPTKLRPNSARTYLSAIPKGLVAAFEPFQFEAAARRGVLYVRYVGGVQ